MSTYCLKIGCKKPNPAPSPSYAFKVSTRMEQCGTSDIHCQNIGDTSGIDKSGLYHFVEIHIKAGCLIDNVVYVFRNHIGKSVIVGYDDHNYSFETIVPSDTIVDIWMDWFNPDCHSGAHELYMKGMVYVMGDNTRYTFGYSCDCGNWGGHSKSLPQRPWRVCGLFGARTH